MSRNTLQDIQHLQFSDKSGAEALLLSFIRYNFPFDVTAVELRPSAISLNSFNGFMTLSDGKRLFFKTHTESDTVIDEYYHAEMLEKAGYPVIKPVFSSTEVGKQFLAYEVIQSPSVFDVAWTIENGDLALFERLSIAQQHEDQQLFHRYADSLQPQSAKEAASAPIHQLFYHRLVGGRLERFYGALPHQSDADIEIDLPGGVHTMTAIRSKKWQINGTLFDESLDTIILRAIQLLKPDQVGPSIVGHGDAHNGNVFLLEDETTPSLLYFDPAFAGRHHPLLDLVKPIFHNAFAMWMYFPAEKHHSTDIEMSIDGDTIRVDYGYQLPQVRYLFLRSKFEHVLNPLVKLLQSKDMLRKDWRAYVKAALFCCPFLKMNLADKEKFPPGISLLGLTMAVEMGSESAGKRTLIDAMLDEAADQLAHA